MLKIPTPYQRIAAVIYDDDEIIDDEDKDDDGYCDHFCFVCDCDWAHNCSAAICNTSRILTNREQINAA